MAEEIIKLFDEIYNCRKCARYAAYYEWLNFELRDKLKNKPKFGPHVPFIKDISKPVDVMIVGIQPGFALQKKMLKNKPLPENLKMHEKYGYSVAFGSHSGDLLSEMLEKHFADKNYYVTNVVKCNTIYIPRKNKIYVADQKEIKTCKQTFFQRELSLLKPKVVIVLGKDAWKALGLPDNKVVVKTLFSTFIFSYHPAAVQRNPQLYNSFENSFILAKQVLGDI